VALHELERALQLADRIAVMDKGRLLTVGSPQEVFKSQAVLESFAFSAAIDEILWMGHFD